MSTSTPPDQPTSDNVVHPTEGRTIFMAKANNHATGPKLDLPALESWLWDAACQIRGPLDAPKFKDYILPLIFLKRLSDVFDDEVAHLAHEFGDARTAAKLVEKDRKLVRFFIPP